MFFSAVERDRGYETDNRNIESARKEGVFWVEEGVGLLIFRILYGHEADPQILLRRATLRFGSQITRIY